MYVRSGKDGSAPESGKSQTEKVLGSLEKRVDGSGRHAADEVDRVCAGSLFRLATWLDLRRENRCQ